MRVALFTDNDFGKVNGVTTTLREVLARTPDDLRPRIYTAARTGSRTDDYFAVATPGAPIPFYREMTIHAPAFGACLREARADGVRVVHLTTPGPMGLVARHVAARLRLPVVGSFHTDLAAYTRVLSGSERLAALMRRYLQWMYGRCEVIFVPSEDTRRLLAGTGTDERRLRLWTRGVDTACFAPSARSSDVRRAWAARDDEPVLIYVGRVSCEKGLDVLPGLVARLRQAGLRHRLVVVGDGPARSALADALPDAIFTGTLDRAGVASALASADLFVFPSRTETAGNVVLEAQACGLPVLVTDGGGAREQMRPGVTGLVSGGPAVMAAHAAALLRDPERRAAMGTAARAHATTRGWAAALAPLYDAWREAAAARGAAA